MKKKNTCLIRVITLMIAVTMIGAGTGFAATLTWDGGGDDANWSAGTNWVGDPGTGPDSGDTIVFDANSTADRNTVCDIALTGITIIVSGDPGGLCSVEATAALTIAGITQGSTAQHLTLSRSGLGSLALSAAAVFEATTQWLTFNGPLNNGDFLLTLQGAGIIVFTGGISGNGGLTLNMSGNQAVTINTAPCTYTGDTTITKGFFTTAAANVLPDNSDISIANDADARLVLSGGAETIGSLSGGGAAGGNVALGGTTVITQTLDGTYAGVISGAHALEKAGANKLTLSGTNTYTGSTTVSAGTLNIQNDQGTGTTAGGVTVYAGASLQLEGGITVDEFLWLYGGGAIELVSVNGNNTWAGVCSLATAPVDIQALSGSLTFGSTILGQNVTFDCNTGDITANGAVGYVDITVTKTGSGTLNLNAANSFGGALIISGGTCVLNHVDAFGTGAGGIYLGADSKLDVNVMNIDPADWEPEITLNGNAEIELWGGEIDENINLGNNTLTFSGGGGVSGDISGTGGITVKVDGMSFSGTNTFSGPLTLDDNAIVGLDNVDAFGTGAGGISLGNGTTLWLGVAINATNWDPAITLTGSATIESDVAGSNIDQLIDIDTNTLTVTGDENLTISGAIGTAGDIGGLTLNMTDVSDILIVSGANVYTGITTVTRGTLNVRHDTGTGATTGGVTVAATNGRLQLEGGVAVGAEVLTLNGDGGAVVELESVIGDNSWMGAITLAIGAVDIKSTAGTLSITGSIGAAGSQNMTFDCNAGDITVYGAISGADITVTKTGAGKLTLSGANDYTGATTVSAGTLNVQHDTGTGDPAGGVFVTAGASLQLQGDVTVGAEALTLNGDGGAVVELESVSGDNTWGGAITLATAAVNIKSTNALGVLTLTGTITGQNVTFDGAGQISAGGVISGGITVTQSGTGALHLGGDNTYTGALSVGAGGLVTLQHINAFGIGGGTLSIGDGGQLVLLTAINATNWDQAINMAGAATIWSEEADCEIGTNINNAVGLLTIRGDESLAISGVIGPGAGGLTVDMTDVSDVVTVSGANTYAGATTVTRGTLNVRHDTGTGAITGGVTVAATNGRLQLEGSVTVGAEPLTLNGDDDGGNVELESISGDNLWAGAVTLATDAVNIKSTAGELTLSGNIGAAQDLVFEGAGTITASGVISGTGMVIKLGASTLTFSGANTYTGQTMLNAGTLLVNAVQGDANDADLTVSNGATLGGTGTVKSDVYVQDGGIIKPGGGVGTLTVAAGTGSNGNVTFQGASRLVVDIQNATKDLLAVGGILTLPAGTATLELEAGYNWSAGSDPYQVVTITGVYDDAGGKVFSDANLPANWSIISTTDTDIKLTYSGVAVVPTLNEWGIIVAFLLLAGAGVMLMRKQRAGNTA